MYCSTVLIWAAKAIFTFNGSSPRRIGTIAGLSTLYETSPSCESILSWCPQNELVHGVGGPENLEDSENVDTISQGLSASSQSRIFSTRPHKWTLHILFESLMKKEKTVPLAGLEPATTHVYKRSIYPLSYGTCVVVSVPNWARTYNCEGELPIHFSKARFLDP